MSIIVDYNKVEVDRAERMVLHDVTFHIEEGSSATLWAEWVAARARS